MLSSHARNVALTLDEISARIITALDQLDRGEGVTGDPAEVSGRVLEAARNRHIR